MQRVKVMRRILFLLILMYTGSTFGQSAITFSYTHSFEKKDLSHHIWGVNLQWQERNKLGSLGFNFFQNTLDYYSQQDLHYFSHGPPGYETSTHKIYDYYAKSTYQFFQLNNDLQWKIASSNKFRSYLGIYVDLGVLLSQKESDHRTEQVTHTLYTYNFESTYSTSYQPTSYESFRALHISRGTIATGFKMSIQFPIKHTFLQFDSKIGVSTNRILDAQWDKYTHQPPVYGFANFFDYKIPLMLQFGLSYGIDIVKKE